MNGFTKLYSGIIKSSIWEEDTATRVVWITFLAVANSDGNVIGDPRRLMTSANVSKCQYESAIEKLQSPDMYSKTPDKEGRRIERIQGGWHLINYDKYRRNRDLEKRREQNRIAKKNQRERDKKEKLKQAMSAGCQQESAQAEAEAEADKEEEEQKHSNDFSNRKNYGMAKARASLSMDLLRFTEDLDESLKPNSKSQRQALLNLIQWIKFQIEEKLLNESVYQKILVIAKDSKSGRVPMAVFFSRLDKEIGYRARVAKQKAKE